MIRTIVLVTCVFLFSKILKADDTRESRSTFNYCMNIAVKQYDRSMDRCFKLKRNLLERCILQAERIYNTSSERCERVFEESNENE